MNKLCPTFAMRCDKSLYLFLILLLIMKDANYDSLVCVCIICIGSFIK